MSIVYKITARRDNKLFVEDSFETKWEGNLRGY